MESYINYTLSLLISLAVLSLLHTMQLYLSSNLKMPRCGIAYQFHSHILLVGFFAMITRKKAITQILGIC